MLKLNTAKHFIFRLQFLFAFFMVLTFLLYIPSLRASTKYDSAI